MHINGFQVPERSDRAAERLLQEVAEETVRGLWVMLRDETPYLLALTTTEVRSGVGSELWTTAVSDLHKIEEESSNVAVLWASDGHRTRIRLARPFARELCERIRAVQREQEHGIAFAGNIPPSRVTTISEFPGHRVVRVHGVVTEISSSSTWTAKAKGQAALEEATATLRAQAERLGANAVIGFGASMFGAGGGVTSIVGGDAVGVLLVGTAVTIEPCRPEPLED
jgi:uncharacterized protein YbjQ (UPF0145 family)